MGFKINDERIEIDSRVISYKELISISINPLRYKGEPNIHNRFHPIESGADNKISLMFPNYKEEKVSFFIGSREEAQQRYKLFERIGKENNLLIMK